MSGTNPLMSAVAARPSAPDDHMMTHAKMWQHVGGMAPDAMQPKVNELDAILPVLGALAGNPNVKAKDVIKAAANAAAARHVSPEQAVKFITQIPPDPDKVGPWLKGLYAANLSAIVHMKAAMLQGAQGAPQAPQGGVPAAPVAAPGGPQPGPGGVAQ